MSNISLILAPTYRSRAIVQLFADTGIKVKNAIILPDDLPHWDGDPQVKIDLYRMDRSFVFEPGKPIEASLRNSDIPFIVSPTKNVNSPEFISFLQNQASCTYIYSGISGCILLPKLLHESGKKFIHAHGGDAPRYSGSTAFYYSMLEIGSIGATVFWMDEGLDTGDIIGKLNATPYEEIEIDRIQDPVIRAEALAIVVAKISNGTITVLQQENAQRVTYHVIHPVLKHLSLKKIQSA